jgi:hypothetical protein
MTTSVVTRPFSVRRPGPLLRVVLLFVVVRGVILGAVMAVAAASGRHSYRVLTSWDGQWYRGIAENGYGFTRIDPLDGRQLSDYAFFPMFPMLERGLSRLTGLTALNAGLLVSASASVVAAVGIYLVAAHLHGQAVGRYTVLLWAVLPAGAVQWMPYSESLFTALAAWCLLGLLTGRLLPAAMLALLAGLTRPTGVAVVAAVLAVAVVRLRRAVLAPRRQLLADLVGPMVALAVAPLGLAGYLLWVGQRLGMPTAYFHVAAGWGNAWDGGIAFARYVVGLLSSPPHWPGLLVVCAVLVPVALLIATVRQRQPVALLVFTGTLMLLALTTSGYFGSKPRYLLPAFPLLIPVARYLARRARVTAAVVISGLVLGATAYTSIWLLGSSPP